MRYKYYVRVLVSYVSFFEHFLFDYCDMKLVKIPNGRTVFVKRIFFVLKHQMKKFCSFVNDINKYFNNNLYVQINFIL